MSDSRSERFAALDRELESALKASGGGGTTVTVGASDPVELAPDSLKTLHKVVHALSTGSEPLLTTTEAADFLGVSRPYLTRLLKTGKIPHLKKGNRHVVPARAVAQFKEERQRKLDELDAMAAAEADLGIR